MSGKYEASVTKSDTDRVGINIRIKEDDGSSTVAVAVGATGIPHWVNISAADMMSGHLQRDYLLEIDEEAARALYQGLMSFFFKEESKKPPQILLDPTERDEAYERKVADRLLEAIINIATGVAGP